MDNLNPDILKHIFNEGVYNLDQTETIIETSIEDSNPIATAPPRKESKEKKQEKPTPEKVSDFQFAREGDPSLGVVLFFNPSSSSSNEEKDFLVKILSAVKTDIRETFICTTASNETFQEVSKKVKVKKAIFWGITPFELGIQDEKFNLYEIGLYNKSFILHVDKLKTIAASQEKKAALWEALKRMFF